MKRYLLFASHSYAFSILRPLQEEIFRRGDEAAWWLEYSCPNLLMPDEKQLHSLKEVRQYNPIATIAPGNWVYPFFPGVKVEVFHGYPMRKRIEAVDDHFTLRGWWDIYCTQGPSSTPFFTELAEKEKYFAIYETGWCKIDSFVNLPPEPHRDRPCILYAPTFSKGLSSAWVMPQTIRNLALTHDWDWIITFHPLLTDPILINTYEQLANDCPNVHFQRINEGIKTFRQSDVLLCDSSSIIVEYLMTDKPVVTLRNTHPGPYLINIQTPDETGEAIERALNPSDALRVAIKEYTSYHEAHRDGKNSAGVLEAIDDFIHNKQRTMRRKPANTWRKIKMYIRYLKTILSDND